MVLIKLKRPDVTTEQVSCTFFRQHKKSWVPNDKQQGKYVCALCSTFGSSKQFVYADLGS